MITIGDEILFGQTLDTNAHWLSGELSAAGIRVRRRTTVSDDERAITAALASAEAMADVVLVTGGLGPTSDDITKPALATFFDARITENQQAMAELEALMSSRGRPINPRTRLQAFLPDNCQPVSNECGTAPGMWFERGGKVFVAMPGVPFEMKHMVMNHVLPRLKNHFQLPVIHHRIVRVVGISESALAERIAPWEIALPESSKIAYLPTYGDIKLRLTTLGDDKPAIVHQSEQLIGQLLPLIQEYAYGYDDETLEAAVGNLLLKKNKKLVLAESCTGGYIAHRITSVPGCSAWFSGGITPYSNDLKTDVLGVSAQVLNAEGAVSEDVVKEMAIKARQVLNADYALATSGIAGPSGGTADKPVGLVWMACADAHGVEARKGQFINDRMANIRFTATYALNLLRQRLLMND